MRGAPTPTAVSLFCRQSNLAQKPNVHYVFNHLDFNITYHSGYKEAWGTSFQGDGTDGARVLTGRALLSRERGTHMLSRIDSRKHRRRGQCFTLVA